MKFAKVVEKVRHGRCARLSGTAEELKSARVKLCSLIDDEHRITMSRAGNCLYVYESDPIVFIPLSQLPRQ